jgi:hypothetical protein
MSITIIEVPIVKHCVNCDKSTETGNPEKSLDCLSNAGKKQFGKNAGGDECAKTCRSFQELNQFSTNGLK